MYPWVENDLGGRIWALSVSSVLFEGFTLPEQVNSAHNMQNEHEIGYNCMVYWNNSSNESIKSPSEQKCSSVWLFRYAVNKNENKENMQIPIFLVKCRCSLGMD